MESWPSGRRRSPAKGVYGQNLYQGFESLTLRHFYKKAQIKSELFYLYWFKFNLTDIAYLSAWVLTEWWLDK